MQEKLIPFDLEAAKKNPERVRFSWGGAPSRIFFNDPTAAVTVADAEGARHCYDYKHFNRLALVAAPKTKRYKPVMTMSGKMLLVAEQFWDIYRCDIDTRRAAGKVRDVSFDKETGTITIAYDE